MASVSPIRTVRLSEAAYRRAVRLARRQGMRIEDLAAQALARYEAECRPAPASVRRHFGEALAALQADAKRSGASKITRAEIDAEIADSRRDRRTNRKRP